jgi:hypothetical protein
MRLAFINALQIALQQVANDALHHSRIYQVELPRGFENGISLANHSLEVYRAWVEEKHASEE